MMAPSAPSTPGIAKPSLRVDHFLSLLSLVRESTRPIVAVQTPVVITTTTSDVITVNTSNDVVAVQTFDPVAPTTSEVDMMAAEIARLNALLASKTSKDDNVDMNNITDDLALPEEWVGREQDYTSLISGRICEASLNHYHGGKCRDLVAHRHSNAVDKDTGTRLLS